jgi:hypothetical protein
MTVLKQHIIYLRKTLYNKTTNILNQQSKQIQTLYNKTTNIMMMSMIQGIKYRTLKNVDWCLTPLLTVYFSNIVA